MGSVPERIMRARLSPRRRGTRVYATWDPADKHESIALSSGNRVATGSGVAWGILRATLPIAGGQHYWETTYTFAGGTDVAAGVATAAASLSGRLGGSAGGTAGPDTLGDFWRDGVKILDLASLTSGVVIRHWLDADAGIYRIAIAGGAWQEATASPSNTFQVWRPAAGLLGAASCSLNAGQAAFAHDVPSSARAGVYDDPIETLTLYVSSTRYGSGPSDDPPNQPYQARIAGGTDVEIEREGSCWVWGGQTRSSRGQLALLLDRTVKSWGALIWRDAEVVIDRGFRTPAGDTWSEWTACLVERHEATDRRLTLTLTDEFARLDTPTQDRLYPETVANAQLMHRPMPLCLGGPLYVDGPLIDTDKFSATAFAHDVHDDAVFGIDAIYDKGDVFTPVADWQYLPDRKGFKLTMEPDGKVVCNPRGAMKRVSTIVDASNGGDFAAWTVPGVYDADPDGWVVNFEDDKGKRFVSDAGGAAHVVSLDTTIRLSKGVLVPGKHYRVDLTVVDISVGTLVVGSNTATPVTIETSGPQTHVFTAAAGSTTLVIEGADCDVTINAVRVYEVRVIEYIRDWLEYLLVTRKGIDPSRVDWDSIDALDATTKQPVRLAHYTAQAPTTAALIRLTLDAWCGWMHTSRAGKLTVGRVQRPAPPAVIRLGKHNLRAPPRRVMDEAPGLTTLMAGGRNHTPHGDSDFVSPPPADGALVAAMKSAWTIVRSALPSSIASSAAKLAPAYAHAEGAEPRPTFMQEADAVQSEISRVGSLWRATPDFWDCDAILSAVEADLAEPGQTAWLQYEDVDGLESGRYVLIKRVRSGFFSNSVVLRVWDPEDE